MVVLLAVVVVGWCLLWQSKVQMLLGDLKL